MPQSIEKSAVENFILQELKKIGWKIVTGNEIDRESLTEPLLIPNLISALKRINKDIKITDDEIRKVENELKLKSSGIDGIKDIMRFLRQGVAVKFESDRVLRYVKLFDFENIESNEFLACSQVYFQGKEPIIPDILLYVNGIPLVDIECKRPDDFGVSWFDAYKQIKDYEENAPELYKYVQIGIAAEQTAKYFPSVPWQKEVKIYEWNEEIKEHIFFENDSLCRTIYGMLTKQRLLDLIRNFTFFREERGEATKVITRYMQIRAGNRIVERVINNIKGFDQKTKGLIWHWQGSGKTLTMIFAANKLYQQKILENPSIFFIIDRTELEEQLNGELNSLELDMPKHELIESVRQLKEILRYDEGRGKRGVFVTLIHKFNPEEFKDLQIELESQDGIGKTILNRKNVIALIDEGHRTQYGILAGQMRNILRSAFLFAFTGTPIAKTGHDTYREFSYAPEELYLDKYFITESLKDKYTVKITYQPKLQEKVHLDKEKLELFLAQEIEELSEDMQERIEEKVRKKLDSINVFLKNPQRIEMIAENISSHFKEELDEKFKAMIVACDRTACVMYKKALDKYLPQNYSEIIMTFNPQKDSENIKKCLKDLIERHKGKEIEDIRKDIINKFKEEEFPKILIVTDMLLAGFDAPVLQTIYLDKLLKEHRLLQAIARTNRPFKDMKETGLIIDYIGIFREFEKAFKIYAKEDIKGAIWDMEEVKSEFLELLDKTLVIFENVPKDYERKSLLHAIGVVSSEKGKEKKFIENYKKLRKLFEVLGTEAIKIQTLPDYKWLSTVYAFYIRSIRAYDPAEVETNVRKYYNKTIRYIYETTEFEQINAGFPSIPFDENYIENLLEKIKAKEERVANIVFTLNRFVLVERHLNPVYESVAEKVERIIKAWKEKSKELEEIYKESVEALNTIQSLKVWQKNLGLSDFEFSVLIFLKDKYGANAEIIEKIKDLCKKIKGSIFEDWKVQRTVRKDIEKKIRESLRKLKLNKEERDDLSGVISEKLAKYE
jgi:type I restriction enzyme R subunit